MIFAHTTAPTALTPPIRLPEPKRARAWDVLERFVAAFNETLPHIENLYECQANPFVTKQGTVDLSGGGGELEGGMSPETPVAFSLPSFRVAGEADAAGLCTVVILRTLERSHNHLVARFRPLAAAAPGSRAALAAGGAAAGTAEAPALSYATPAPLLRRSLLHYDRARDLAPALSRAAQQPLGPANCTRAPAFDGAILERDLAHSLK